MTQFWIYTIHNVYRYLKKETILKIGFSYRKQSSIPLYFTKYIHNIKKPCEIGYSFTLQTYLLILTFMGPCIVRIFQYISNKMQRYTVYFIWKLLCMFRVVPPPIIRSAYNCIYSIWYLSYPYCYLLLSWKSWNWQTSSNTSTIVTGISNGMTDTRCCRYSCMRS